MTETTQDSLNVRLAKWAGYSVRYYRDFSGVEHWDLLNSAGELAPIRDDSFGLYPAHSEAEVWQHAPDYASSLDAGMALVRTLTNVTAVWFALGGEKPVVSIQYEKPNEMYPGDVWFDSISAEGDTDSAALAHALDAMRQQQEDAK